MANRRTTAAAEILDLLPGSYYKFTAEHESPSNIDTKEKLQQVTNQYFVSLGLIKALEMIGRNSSRNGSELIAGSKEVSSNLRSKGHYITTTQVKLLTRSKRANYKRLKSSPANLWTVRNQISAKADLILNEVVNLITQDEIATEEELTEIMARFMLNDKMNKENYILCGQLLSLISSYSDEELYEAFKGNTDKSEKFKILLSKLTHPK